MEVRSRLLLPKTFLETGYVESLYNAGLESEYIFATVFYYADLADTLGLTQHSSSARYTPDCQQVVLILHGLIIENGVS